MSVTMAAPVAAALMGLLLFAFLTAHAPRQAPFQEMYATEQTMRHLVTALNVYRAHYAAYPPADNGLNVAMVLHCGPSHVPLVDGWGNPFVYVPAAEYRTPGSQALQKDGRYFAPGTYQLYSVGADGMAGTDAPAAQADNIVSWASSRQWRPCYRKMYRRYDNVTEKDPE